MQEIKSVEYIVGIDAEIVEVNGFCNGEKVVSIKKNDIDTPENFVSSIIVYGKDKRELMELRSVPMIINYYSIV